MKWTQTRILVAIVVGLVICLGAILGIDVYDRLSHSIVIYMVKKL